MCVRCLFVLLWTGYFLSKHFQIDSYLDYFRKNKRKVYKIKPFQFFPQLYLDKIWIEATPLILTLPASSVFGETVPNNYYVKQNNWGKWRLTKRSVIYKRRTLYQPVKATDRLKTWSLGFLFSGKLSCRLREVHFYRKFSS